MKKTILLLCLGLSSFGFSQSCFDGGTGVDGAYVATVNTTIAGGTYNFTSFTINPGVTVSVTGTIPLEIFCQGNMVINGTLTANGGNGTNGITNAAAGTGGIGVAGGGNGGNGSYSSSVGEVPANDGANTGGVGTLGAGWSGGGGAGYAAAGQSTGGSTGGFGGPAYGTSNLSTLTSGSGGGGGSGGYNCGGGGGGAGGGIIFIHSTAVSIGAGGMISSNGGNGGSDGSGNCGGGGAGSGGTIWIESPTITNNGTISTTGGTGGISTIGGTPYYGVGGNGSNGRIRIDGPISGSGSTNPPVGFFGPLPIPTSNQTITICYAETFTVGSNTYSTSGNYSDTLATAAGCDSIVNTDLTVLPQNSTTQSFTICEGESVTVGTNTYSTDGTFTDVLTAANGCDSSVVTTIVVETIDETVSNVSNILTANSTVGTYQWLDCNNNNVAIPGETNQTFSPATVGSYAVVVTVGNCSDTSACEVVDFASISESSIGTISIFPNPTEGTLHLAGIDNITGFESIEIYALNGQRIVTFNTLKATFDLSFLNQGVYFMELQFIDHTETIRFVKQ